MAASRRRTEEASGGFAEAFGDIFGDIFGGAVRRRRRRAGWPAGQPRQRKAHDIFERDGDDLHCTVPVGLRLTLGGTIEVPTPGGNAEIELPEGTQHGKTFRLRGKGIKGIRSSYPGDLYAHIAVETPVQITERQRKLLKELDDSFRRGRRAAFDPDEKSWAEPREGPVQVAVAPRTRALRAGHHPRTGWPGAGCVRQTVPAA